MLKSVDTPTATCSLYQGLSMYEFIRNKTYQEAGCLIYPTTKIANFVEELETFFSAIFGVIIYMPCILTRLCQGAEKLCNFLTWK